jgi:lysophospholipase L1-like esterase
VTLVILLATPVAWKHLERFDTGADYRIPYALSKDYWLYERHLERSSPTNITVVGDSVVWGEYVRADGTLSHFLNERSGQPGLFVNAGVNGLFPLALEGLVQHDGASIRNAKVLLHCNLLWMSSPKADLQTTKEERFNHAGLVPQFSPRIPCYKADLNQRLVAMLERSFTFLKWASHLQIAYFGQKNVLAWTLEEDGGEPPRFPNAYKDPLAQITLHVPAEPDSDPERGPDSPRHRPWSTSGEGSTRFDWVKPETSMQWAAFQRLVHLLQDRGNDVLVVVGPFNEHLLAQDNRPSFRQWTEAVQAWLSEQGIAHVIPATLPSLLYADASHPLTEGYQQMAADVWDDPVFARWLQKTGSGSADWDSASVQR